MQPARLPGCEYPCTGVCCERQLLQTWNSDAVFQGGIFSEYWIYYVVIYSIAFYIKMWYFLKELSGSIGVMMWPYDPLTCPWGSHCAKLSCARVCEKNKKHVWMWSLWLRCLLFPNWSNNPLMYMLEMVLFTFKVWVFPLELECSVFSDHLKKIQILFSLKVNGEPSPLTVGVARQVPL